MVPPSPVARPHRDRWLALAGLIAISIPLVLLALLLVHVVVVGVTRIDIAFLTSFPSRFAHRAGILPGIVGSLCLLFLTSLIAIPLGVGTAVYLEEYRREGFWRRIVELNIANLASVPPVIYGMLGLEVFVRGLHLGRGLIAAAATLALLVLPMIILSTQNALRGVSDDIREAALSLGGSRWRTLWHVILPLAGPRIISGVILAISRAIGEAAPLIVIGAVSYVAFLPDGLSSPFTALPIQTFNWLSRPQSAFQSNAAGAIVVLLALLFSLNAIALRIEARALAKEASS